MNNKTATYIGFGVLMAAPIAYFAYRDTVYGFIKGSFKGDIKPLGRQNRDTNKSETEPEVTQGKPDKF